MGDELFQQLGKLGASAEMAQQNTSRIVVDNADAITGFPGCVDDPRGRR